jgi:leucyl aminopeptidase
MITTISVASQVSKNFSDSAKHYDAIAIPVYEADSFPVWLLDVLPVALTTDFKATYLSSQLAYTTAGARILLVGVGKKEALTEDRLRHASGAAGRVLSGYEKPAVLVSADLQTQFGDGLSSRVVLEGVLLGSHVFDKYKSEKKEAVWQSLALLFPDKEPETVTTDVTKATTMARATAISRELANSPANDLTPTAFVAYAKSLLVDLPVTLEVIDRDKAKALGMGSFLSVGQGSDEPSYLLVMRYFPLKEQQPVGLVGKGVTFDSGGISIKPGRGMKDMKADMTGAASVLAAVWGAATLGISKNVLGIVALTENMPSGNALKPGDIIRAMNGKTIEIVNTDAEGRLILADALTLACREDASPVIDMATLTGACGVALGDLACGVLGNDPSLIAALSVSGEASGERVWQLPLYDGFLDAMSSDVADIANANETGKGGTCTAAKFLEQFIDGRPWAHVDIASMMISGKTSGYQVKGMSGVGARLLLGYLLNA